MINPYNLFSKLIQITYRYIINHIKLDQQINGGFTERIKWIIQLEEDNQQCLKINLNNLNRQKISL
ncbi:unnamed protein product [Paramecium sonneborni]|uniref:Uncharacterized protein n=1 Tax=Paramecium sonneborni TaxID=65129 RepID=A0A8S1QWP4_9CILI|nr:unnamed protein product [Paramecium sonneborni]